VRARARIRTLPGDVRIYSAHLEGTSVREIVDRITGSQDYSGTSRSVRSEGRQCQGGRFLIANGAVREKERERDRQKKRRGDRSLAAVRVHVPARATKEESRCEVRPTLSPSKRLTTFRPAPRAQRSVAGFWGRETERERERERERETDTGRRETSGGARTRRGKVPGDGSSF